MTRSPQDPDPADRDDLEPDDEEELTDKDLPSEADTAAGEEPVTWTPPRGRLTRIVAWLVIALVVLGSLAMLVLALRPR